MEKKSSAAVVKIKAVVFKFGKNGEKSGWSYIVIPASTSNRLFPGNKKSFRVKGFLDHLKINCVALLPMGNGDFIIPINGTMRKATGKNAGDTISVQLQIDKTKPSLSKDLMKCLADDPDILLFFKKLPRSHQNYFSKWVDSAKTGTTKAKRIALTMNALAKKNNYRQMEEGQGPRELIPGQ